MVMMTVEATVAAERSVVFLNMWLIGSDGDGGSGRREGCDSEGSGDRLRGRAPKRAHFCAIAKECSPLEKKKKEEEEKEEENKPRRKSVGLPLTRVTELIRQSSSRAHPSARAEP